MSDCKAHGCWALRNQSGKDAPFDAPKPVFDYPPTRSRQKAARIIAIHRLCVVVFSTHLKLRAASIHSSYRSRGPLGAAHDRAEFVVKRRKMMQLCTNHLDELRHTLSAGGAMRA